MRAKIFLKAIKVFFKPVRLDGANFENEAAFLWLHLTPSNDSRKRREASFSNLARCNLTVLTNVFLSFKRFSPLPLSIYHTFG